MLRLSDWVAADADSVGDSEATSAADERLVAAFAVCDCGICEHGLVDEDGLCASCGVCPILVADRASAEEVVGLREDVEAATARAEAAEQRAEAAERELAQARDDRALLAGLWLATVPHDVLPALLPTDPADRDRLAAALDAVDLQPSEAAHIAAGRAVVARIVAETGGGAA